ncbi:MAG: hypothetical protein ACTSSK_06165 [Candidatus Heimdallarchaeota archaeon]
MKIGNIEDELTEIIKLKNAKIILVEWLPFDRNQLSALNLKLDSLRLERGHIVTALQEESPSNLIFNDEGISCKVVVNDYSQSEYVSFNAHLNYPEDNGIIQNETLSGHINSWGRVVFGAELYEVEGSVDGWVSLDVLTRIIADLTVDTSLMLDSLITEYQRNLIDLVFLNESGQRPKSILILADDINRKPDNPDDFFDGEELQNELEQILNVLQKVDKFDNDYLFQGTVGLIAVSDNIKVYEESYLERAFSTAIRVFLDDYSARIWHLWDESHLIEENIDQAMLGDVTSLANAQNWITKASSDAIMLGDILSYLRDSINEFLSDLTQKEPIRSLDDSLIEDLRQIQNDSLLTNKRVNDTQKVIHGLESKMIALRDFSNTLAERHMRRISDSMAQNTKTMMQMTESNNRASDALSIIEFILAGSVLMEVVLLVVGEYAIPGWMESMFAKGYGSFIILGITIVLWIGMFIFLRVSKRRLESSAIKRQSGNYVIGRRCNIIKLNEYLATKEIVLRNTEKEGGSEWVSISWDPIEDKKNHKPIVDVAVLDYDANEQFIIQIYLESPDLAIKLEDCYDYLINEMEKFGVFTLVIDGESC